MKNLVAFRTEIDIDHETKGLDDESHFDHRTRGVDMHHLRQESTLASIFLFDV